MWPNGTRSNLDGICGEFSICQYIRTGRRESVRREFSPIWGNGEMLSSKRDSQDFWEKNQLLGVSKRRFFIDGFSYFPQLFFLPRESFAIQERGGKEELLKLNL